jgi:hypothetical protein
VAADVKFMNPSGTLNHIAANTPAIPWTSSTGFGPSDGPPTTAATVDLTTFAGRWVTFILAGAGGSTQPMYVCQVTDWQAVAGPAGGRTVIPLDLWELHSWRYCGPEFTGEQALPNSGRYTASGGVAVAASTDVTTHGDYGTQYIAFPIAYAAGLVPAVVPASEDAAFAATVSNINNTGFDVTVRRVRSLTQPLYGELDMTIPGGNLYNSIDTQVFYGVTFDSKPVVHVEVIEDDQASDGESQYQASLHDRAVDNFWPVIFHMPHPAGFVTTEMYDLTNTTPASTTPISTGGPSDAYTDDPWTGTDGTFGAESPSTSTEPDHAHGIPNADYTTGTHSTGNAGSHHHDHHHKHHHDHTHGTGNHVHRADIFPKETADRTLRVGWTAQGQQHADATHVPVSWVARG